jgi:hypothetical protein
MMAGALGRTAAFFALTLGGRGGRRSSSFSLSSSLDALASFPPTRWFLRQDCGA